MKRYWVWFGACELLAVIFFWVPVPALWWHHHHIWLPLGLTFIVLLCLFEAWTPSVVQESIKPLDHRTGIDAWDLPINSVFGNPEDGVSGMDAVGPSWDGFYNPTGSRWLAILWNCRNWMAGFNYITWLWPDVTPPLIVKQYTTPWGSSRQLKIGWQQRYGKTVMVCSA